MYASYSKSKNSDTPQLKDKILKGGVWAVIGRILSAVVALVINAVLARILSPDEIGAYFLGASIASFLPILSQAGLNQTVIRYIAASEATNNPYDARRAAGLALALVVGLSGLIFFLYSEWLGSRIAVHVFSSPLLAVGSVGVAAWAFFSAIQNITADIFRGYHRIDFATWIGGLASGLCSACLYCIFWFFKIHASLMVVFSTSALSVGVTGLYGLWRAREKLVFVVGGDGFLNRMASTAWPIWINNVAIFFVLQANIWVVGAFLPAGEVAIFGASARLAGMFSMISTMLYSVLPPIVAELYAKNEINRLQTILRGASTLGAIILAPALLVLFIAAPEILKLAYGSFYASGSGVLILLAFGHYFNVATGIRGYVLMMAGFEKIQLVIALIGGGIGLLLTGFAARSGSVTLCALATMLGIVLQCFMEMIYVKKKINIFTHVELSRADLRAVMSLIKK